MYASPNGAGPTDTKHCPANTVKCLFIICPCYPRGYIRCASRRITIRDERTFCLFLLRAFTCILIGTRPPPNARFLCDEIATNDFHADTRRKLLMLQQRSINHDKMTINLIVTTVEIFDKKKKRKRKIEKRRILYKCRFFFYDYKYIEREDRDIKGIHSRHCHVRCVIAVQRIDIILGDYS